jgi:hypothetical protein
VRSRLVVGVFAGSVWGLAPSTVSPTVWPIVAVPARDEYNPKNGSLHDYCTGSPDQWDRADFTGPCANHDRCSTSDAKFCSECGASTLADSVGELPQRSFKVFTKATWRSLQGR